MDVDPTQNPHVVDGPSAEPGRPDHVHPGEGRPGDGEAIAPPRLVAWEVTRSCNLACVHCRASAVHGPYPNELTTDEAFTLVDQIASFANPILILTGGDPLMRADVFDIAERGIGQGLRVVMSPNGTLVTPEAARRMKDVGIARISISVDFPTAEEHDSVPRRARRLRGRDARHPHGDRGRRRGADQLHHHEAERAPPAGAARAGREASAP